MSITLKAAVQHKLFIAKMFDTQTPRVKPNDDSCPLKLVLLADFPRGADFSQIVYPAISHKIDHKTPRAYRSLDVCFEAP